MVIGVKFCGGCNSVYNRSKQITLLKEQFPEHEYIKPSDGKECDVWLIVCGCPRTCVSTEGLTAHKKMFVIGAQHNFREVIQYLKDERENASDADSGEDQRTLIRIGQEGEMKKTILKSDVDQFASLTGDYSRLHTDADFAKKSVYGRPVVHGVLVASLISSVMGMKLPGEGTVFIDEEVRFLKPVFCGDTITAKVRFVSCKEYKEQYVGTFSGVCVNQEGEVVVCAKCRQLMTKELFVVEDTSITAEYLDQE
jgi:acyl dehydratase